MVLVDAAFSVVRNWLVNANPSVAPSGISYGTGSVLPAYSDTQISSREAESGLGFGTAEKGYILTSGVNVVGTSFTVDGWFRVDGYTGGDRGRLFTKAVNQVNANPTQAAWFLGYEGTASFVVSSGATTDTLNATMNTANWHHVAGVFQRITSTTGSRYLFVDGSLFASGAATYGGVQDYGSVINVGDAANLAQGSVAWCRVSNLPLWTSSFNAEELRFHRGPDSTTLLLYDFTEGTGSIVYDKSDYGVTGSITSGLTTRTTINGQWGSSNMVGSEFSRRPFSSTAAFPSRAEFEHTSVSGDFVRNAEVREVGLFNHIFSGNMYFRETMANTTMNGSVDFITTVAINIV